MTPRTEEGWACDSPGERAGEKGRCRVLVSCLPVRGVVPRPGDGPGLGDGRPHQMVSDTVYTGDVPSPCFMELTQLMGWATTHKPEPAVTCSLAAQSLDPLQIPATFQNWKAAAAPQVSRPPHDSGEAVGFLLSHLLESCWA